MGGWIGGFLILFFEGGFWVSWVEDAQMKGGKGERRVGGRVDWVKRKNERTGREDAALLVDLSLSSSFFLLSSFFFFVVSPLLLLVCLLILSREGRWSTTHPLTHQPTALLLLSCLLSPPPPPPPLPTSFLHFD